MTNFIRAIVVLMVLFSSSSSFCGNIGFIGAGARSSGMGGAFIAVADDATSIFWNPAGLTHLLEREVSIVGKFESNSWDFPKVLNILTPDTMSSFSLNFASFAYPTKIYKRNFTFAVCAASIYDFNFNDKVFRTDSSGNANLNYLINEEAKGKLYQLSAGFAYEVFPSVSFGSAFNWHYGTISGPDTTEKSLITGNVASEWTEKDTLKGGSSIYLGLFADLPYKWHIGGVGKIRFDDIEWSGESEGNYYDSTIYSSLGTVRTGFSQKNSFPNSYGIGLSFTPSDYVTVAADYSIIKWSQYKINGEEPMYNNGNKKFVDVPQGHIGFEYLLPKSFLNEYPMPVRLGLYTDPFPIQYEDKTGITGTFFTVGAGFVFDFGQIDFSIEYGTRDWGYSRNENIVRVITSTIFKI